MQFTARSFRGLPRFRPTDGTSSVRADGIVVDGMVEG